MKEDDMDEMLRKAAENYEVDADKAADWNAVYNAVHETEATPVEEKKRRRFFVFWWLLLIPLGWIAHTAYNKFNIEYAATKKTAHVALKPETKSSINTIKSSEDASINNTPANNNMIVDKNDAYHKQFLFKKQDIQKENSNKTTDLNIENYLVQQQQPVTVQSLNESSGQLNNITTTETNKNNSVINIPPVINDQKNTASDLNNSKNSAPVVTPTTAKSKTIKIKSNSHYFYAGLLAGADVSFIKYQKMQPVGYNAGLLVGYKFNKLSIESGLLIDKKNYYTSGEYFDKSKIPFFNNAEVLSVNGYCKMYEIPLNIKYDFNSSKKHTWYATAGLSSYLMNKELYNYAYTQNGWQQHGSYPYYHTTQNWFSVVNLSAGYQLQTGAKTNLRIEPYYKTTLTGVGTGSLKISSAGINVGITRRLP